MIKDNDLLGKDIVLGIRPEDLEDVEFSRDAKDSNVINAKVEVTEPMGAEIYLYIDIDGVLITARVNPRSKLRSGDAAKLHVDIEKLHLFNKETEKAYV